MTLKTAKLQIDQLQQENKQLKLLIKNLEEKIDILEDTIEKYKFLNHINEKYGKNLGN